MKMMSLFAISSFYFVAIFFLVLICNDGQSISTEESAHSHFIEGQEYQYYKRCSAEGLNPIQCNRRIISSYDASRKLIKLESNFNSNTALSFIRALPFNYLGMLNDLAVCLLKEGLIQESRSALSDIVDLDPTHLHALGNLAHIEAVSGRYDMSNDYYRRALAVEPDSATLLYNYGTFLYNNGKSLYGGKDISKNITDLWLSASALSPTLHNAYVNLAVQACGTNDRTRTFLYYNEALTRSKLNVDTGIYWGVVLQTIVSVIPVIPSDKTDLLHSRSILVSQLEKFIKDVPIGLNNLDLFELVGCGSLGYYLAYHGFEDILLKQLYAASFLRIAKSQLQYIAPFLLLQNQAVEHERLLKSKIINILENHYVFNTGTYPTTPFISQNFMTQSSAILNSKIKVGFISAFFVHHSVGLLLRGVIKRLNRDIFDVYLFFVGKEMNVATYKDLDYVLDGYTSNSNINFIELRGYPLHHARSVISSHEIDVLVFGEIGMDHTTYFAAFSRLATRSMFFWGHAMTSGISERLFESSPYLNGGDQSDGKTADESGKEAHAADYGGIDYFISSTLFEADISTCQFEYTERLLLHSGLSVYFEWPMPPFHRTEVVIINNSSMSSDINTPAASIDEVDSSSASICTADAFTSDCCKSIRFPASRLLRNNVTTIIDDISVKRGLESSSDDSIIQWDLPTKRNFLCKIDPSFCYFILPKPEIPFVLISIPQTLYKFHVDIDSILLRILTNMASENVNAYIALIKGSNSTYELVKARLEAAWGCEFRGTSNASINNNGSSSSRSGDVSISNKYGRGDSISNTPCDRVMWLPHMDERSFLTLVAVSDLALDSFPLGGGRSSLEILSTATPIVSLFPRRRSGRGGGGVEDSDGHHSNYEENSKFGRGQQSFSQTTGSSPSRTSSGRISGSVADSYADHMNLGESPTILQLTPGMYQHMQLSFAISIDDIDNALFVTNSFGEVVKLKYSHVLPTKASEVIHCCVVYTVSEYIRLAIIIAKSPRLMAYLSNEIQTAILGTNSIFEDMRSVYEWEYSLLHVLTLPRPKPERYISGEDLLLYVCDVDVDQEKIPRNTPKHMKETLAKVSLKELHRYQSICTVAMHDYRWNLDEFKKTIFSYTEPIILKDAVNKSIRAETKNVVDERNHIGTSAIMNAKTIAMPATAPDINDTTNLDRRILYTTLMSYIDEKSRATTDYAYVFSYYSNEEDVGTPAFQRFEVVTDVGQDWLASCLNSTELDRVKKVVICLMIAFEYERSLFPLVASMDMEFKQANLASESKPVSFSLPIHHLVDTQLIMRGISTLNEFLGESSDSCMLHDLVSGEISRHSNGLYYDMTSAALVLSRRVVGRKMLCRILSLEEAAENISDGGAVIGIGDKQRDFLLNSYDETEYSRCLDLIRSDINSKFKEFVPSTSGHFDRPLAADSTNSPTSLTRNHGTTTFKSEGGISIGITTSRRLPYFLATINAFLYGLGGMVPNEFIRQIIVVDDFSSVEDRLAMMTLYPTFTFVMKSELERGHANSLNTLLKLVKTRYFMYLEDDWKLLPKITLMENFFHESVHPVIEVLMQESRRPCIVLPPLIPILVSSLVTIGFQGNLSIPLYYTHNYDPARQTCADDASNYPESAEDYPKLIAKYVNLSITKSSRRWRVDKLLEDIHVVLLNDQTSRDSAEIRFELPFERPSLNVQGYYDPLDFYMRVPDDVDANKDLIGTGGWPRSVRYNIKVGDESTIKPLSASYFYHEFGFIPSNCTSSKRTNAFGRIWPSLSLNPGLWDLESILHRLQAFREEGGESGQGRTQTFSPFSEDDASFERIYSISSYAAGLNLAYLPALVFKHIGADSAYAINGVKREWEK